MNTETKHTPGPWYLDFGGGYGKGFVYADAFPTDEAGRKFSLAAAHFPPLYQNGETSQEACDIAEANARLIAAAPDMLGALQKIIDMNVQYAIDRYGDAAEAETMSCVTIAREAIAKAVAAPVEA